MQDLKPLSCAAVEDTIRRPTLMLGLSCAVIATQAQFAPMPKQYGMALFGDLRWRGFAAALRCGMADRLVVFGGHEPLLSADVPAAAGVAFHSGRRIIQVPRGYACCHALANQHGIDPDQLDWKLTEPSTRGNITAIAEMIAQLDGVFDLILSSSLFHLPRALMDAADHGIAGLRSVPTEAYLVVEAHLAGRPRAEILAELIEGFGGGDLAERSAGEICGAADKLLGTYRSNNR